MSGVEVDNWLTSLMKERRSIWLAGVEKFAMACVMDGSMWYPADERWKPAKLTVGCANSYLDVMHFSLQC